MADLRHVKTFENYYTPETEGEEVELNEAIGDTRKKTIDAYLETKEKPSSEDKKNILGKVKKSKLDKALSAAFGDIFGSNKKMKKDILALSFDDKIDLLTKASKKLEDAKVGNLKIFIDPKSRKYTVGGVGVKAGSGGGRNG